MKVVVLVAGARLPGTGRAEVRKPGRGAVRPERRVVIRVCTDRKAGAGGSLDECYFRDTVVANLATSGEGRT